MLVLATLLLIYVVVLSYGFYLAEKKPIKDRICVNCRHFLLKEQEGKKLFLCTRPETVKIDRVTGELSNFNSCKFERESTFPFCGINGKFFEKK